MYCVRPLCFLIRFGILCLDKTQNLNILQAENQQTDIRTSFDDSSAPLLQHEDRDTNYSSGAQFDLE